MDTEGHGEPGADDRSDELLRLLHNRDVQEICESARELLNVEGVAIALLARNDSIRELICATDSVSQELDELQFTLGEGPCIDAFSTVLPEIHPDLTAPGTRERWPAFTSDAIEIGVLGLFVFPVPAVGTPFGVLELYRADTSRFSTEDVRAATLVAQAAAEAVLNDYQPHNGTQENQAPQAEKAGLGRSHINIAVGMVAVQLGVSVDTALARLRAYCYAEGLPISFIARELVERRLILRDDREGSDFE